MIKNFDEMLSKVKQNENKKTVVIAAAQVDSAIEAAVLAKKENLADSILVGDKPAIEDIIKRQFPEFTSAFQIVDTGKDLNKACAQSVQLIRENAGHIILKGAADTALILKAALDKENGLRTGEVISDVLAYETPERIVLMTDGGINLYPNLDEKISIVKNAVKVAHAMGNPLPKVALLAAVEVVNPKMQCTLDASIIAKMNQRNQIAQCIIDGPLAFDNAINMEAAKMKKIDSPVAGQADILIVPNIEAGNIFGKCLTYYCNWRVAHVVMGTKAPILIASRADTAEVKMLCMAMGAISAN
ncbi:MAG TPA: phosphate acyltransferase [Candidatus Cloacimonadota bacterium]|jgi:phosphate butyryltransferase|nr:phosphate acyltransferase [Candidatus Cloacimonadales bacterium]HOE90503.1 phosphate acyltransferase [Candidatus Cloacimonadota bacterium]HOQ80601.1 phosphate acyltransferase [Candidatus Cloacimonadota bacterium]HPY97097.1 phosphate acyltransferase [Candidatus Cloacimonadota bacterium]HQB41476.1 phosphate acyltransferase [Candidatus Cloacimonadota bacterium]